MRGKRRGGGELSGGDGITPAGAGKTTSDGLFRAVCWDHPRRCGENSDSADAVLRMPGSPPQVRGKLAAACLTTADIRITPAGAGKTRRCCAHRPKSQDHPRRCGENAPARSSNSPTQGSPPQVRGKLYCFACGAGGDGITPAGAGKTLSVLLTPSAFQDHPRRCGENDK